MTSLADARVRLLNAQADLREFELERERGKYLPSTEVLATWQRRFAEVRARLLSIPDRIGSQTQPSRVRDELLALFEHELHEAMREIAGDGEAP